MYEGNCQEYKKSFSVYIQNILFSEYPQLGAEKKVKSGRRHFKERKKDVRKSLAPFSSAWKSQIFESSGFCARVFLFPPHIRLSHTLASRNASNLSGRGTDLLYMFLPLSVHSMSTGQAV